MSKLHKHLLVRADVMLPPKAKDAEFVAGWLSKLIAEMGMQELRAPTAVYCDQAGNRGMTADILLTTSHAILHTWDECDQPFIEFDVYTCSDLDPQMVLRALNVFLPVPKKVEWMFIDRYEKLRLIRSH